MEASIAGLSMSMASSNVSSQVSMKLLDKALDADAEAGARLIDNLQQMPPPAAVSEIGGLLNITA